MSIQNPGISLFAMVHFTGVNRYWGDRWFILYDKDKYSVEFLEQNKISVYNTFEDEDKTSPLDLCFLHMVDRKEPFRQIDVNNFTSESDQFVVNPDYNQDVAQGVHICSISEAGMKYAMHGEEFSSLQLYCGYFVYNKEQKIPDDLEEFNNSLTLSNFDLLDDWQNVNVIKDRFIDVYSKAVDEFRKQNFSGLPGDDEYQKFFFHI